MQISSMTSGIDMPLFFVFQQSHPLFKAIERGDEQAILKLTQKDGDNSFKKDDFTFDFKELVQELPKLLKCLSEQSLSLEARYRAAHMLRKMIFQVVEQQPSLIDQKTLFPLESLYSSFESYLPTLFEVIVCHELIKTAIQDQGDQALCFKNICDKMHNLGLLKNTSLPVEAKKTKEAVRQFFQFQEMLLSQADLSAKIVGKSEKLLLLQKLESEKKTVNEIEKEIKQKTSPDLAQKWANSILSLHIYHNMIVSMDALKQDLAKPGRPSFIIQTYVDKTKVHPQQIDEALDSISQQLQTSFLEKQKEELEDEFKDLCCPITGVLMEEPMMAEDGHSYEKSAIEKHFKTSTISPMTGMTIDKKLRHNFTLKKIIQTIKEQRAKTLKRVRIPEEQASPPEQSRNPKDSSSKKLKAPAEFAPFLNNNAQVSPSNEQKKMQKEFYLEMIKVNPSDESAYVNLGKILDPNEKITLLNGNEVTAQELFLKAIACNPSYSLAYLGLADTLPLSSSIKLLNGTEMTNQDLYLKAIHLDPTLDFAYINLGNTLARGEKIKLLNGTEMTNQDLYLKAISLNPCFGLAYTNLGNTLVRGEQIKLLDETMMTNQDLYILAIHLDPTLDAAYVQLGKTLSRSEKTRLRDNTEVSSQQLYLKAIELNPSRGVVYADLANTLAFGGSIRLLNGTEMTKQELYLKAIHLNPSLIFVYLNLSTTMAANETIKLLDGTEMTKQQLELKAAQLKNSNTNF